MTIPIPPWVSWVGSVTPLFVGVTGILVGRKVKTATDDLQINNLTKRVVSLETAQSANSISIATLQNTLEYLAGQIGYIEECSNDTAQTMHEIRGVLYQMAGQTPPPPQPRRRRPVLPNSAK